MSFNLRSFDFFLTDFLKMVNTGSEILFTSTLSVTHRQILHNKLIKEYRNYKASVIEKRNITNMIL